MPLDRQLAVRVIATRNSSMMRWPLLFAILMLDAITVIADICSGRYQAVLGQLHASRRYTAPFRRRHERYCEYGVRRATHSRRR